MLPMTHIDSHDIGIGVNHGSFVDAFGIKPLISPQLAIYHHQMCGSKCREISTS